MANVLLQCARDMVQLTLVVCRFLFIILCQVDTTYLFYMARARMYPAVPSGIDQEWPYFLYYFSMKITSVETT